MIKRCVLTTTLAALLTACVGGWPLPAAALGPAPAPLSVGDGLTRDSLDDFGAPEPAPAVEPVPAPAHAVPTKRRHARAALTHRHHKIRQAPARRPIRVVKRAPEAHRNLVVSFVYWWNGWVIRTFHTTNGTVLLKRVGAKA